MIFDVNAWVGHWPFRSLRDNTPARLVDRLDRCGIDVAAVSSLDAIFHRNAQPANEQLCEDVAAHADRLVPMATINPTYARWEDDVEACHATLGMKGVRLFPQYHDYRLDGPEGRRVVACCTERGLPISIPYRMEDARQRHWMDPGRVCDLEEVANVLLAVPDAVIIVPNAKNIVDSSLWRNPKLRGASWYVDLSLVEVRNEIEPKLQRLLDEGGGGHVVFGSHVPMSYAGPALVKRATLPVSADELEAISFDRAAALFGLSPSLSRHAAARADTPLADAHLAADRVTGHNGSPRP